jgi:tRNA(Ile)-lysidine synthase
LRLTALESGIAQALRGLGHPSAGDRVVVGLSGGADSVSLLDVLAKLARRKGFTVVAAHLDHGLRPDSAQDAAFCAELCARLAVPLRTGHADVRGRDRAEGGGMEEAARLARHAFLRQIKDEEGAAWIVLAHTRDDQAETVLLRLLRGAGGLGLSGMRPRAGDLLRPMLALSRADVLDHLAARSLLWREDPSNADLGIARNRVRRELLPYLERHFNPAVREALARSAAVLAEEAEVLATVAADARRAQGRQDEDGSVLSIDALRSAPRALARLAVRRALQEAGGLRGVGLEHVESILDLAATAAPSGRRVALPAGREAVFHFGEVHISRRRKPGAAFALPLSVPGAVALPDGSRFVARAARGPAGRSGASTVVAVPDEPLEVRTRRPGDRVRAAGREVSLRRFLMDKRVPAQDRGSLPLLAAGHRVFWVPGQHLDGAEGSPRRFVRVELCAAGSGRQR